MGLLARILGRQTPAPPSPMHALPSPSPPKADGADCIDPGQTDIYGYGLSREFVETLYETDKLASRIVDLMVYDMTRLPLQIDAGIFDGPKISAWIDAACGRQLAAHAMIFARLYGGGALLAFVEDGLDPSLPVDFRNITHIAGYVPVHRYELTVQSWDRRPDSRIAGVPNFGQPRTYNVHPLEGSAGPDGQRVGGIWHRSRVIPWMNIPTLPRHRRSRYNGWSPGEIERLIKELLARSGGMEHVENLLRSFGFDVMEIANLQAKLATTKGTVDVDSRLRHLSKSLQITNRGVRVVAIDAGNGTAGPAVKESLTPMARPVNGVRELSDAQRDHLQEKSDYPASILYGKINAGLGNGEALGEKQAHYDQVGARQVVWYIPQMQQMAELECAAQDGPTGGIIPPKLVITCPSLWSTPEDTAAEVRLKNSQARKYDMESTSATVDEIRTDKELARHYTQAEPEDLTDAATLEEDAAEAQIPGDLEREIDLQRQLKVGKKSFMRWVTAGKVKPWATAAGRRYSRAEVIAAMTEAPKADALEPMAPVLESVAASMQPVIVMLEKAAPTDAPVLILGESGTGKEVAARSVHEWSGRRGPFMAINCAVLDDDVPLSELLERLGLAAGGTAFLDELGELTPVCQAKLLRVLGGAVRDVRWVAATNRDLQAMIAAGSFRGDLYYRLAVMPVVLPALRDRQEDLEPMAERMLESMCGDLGRRPLRLDATATAYLHNEAWPGNVRQLKNVLERAAILAESSAKLLSAQALQA